MADALTHSATMVGRSVRLSSRNPDAVITALALPVLLMLVFVYLFGGAIDTGGGWRYVDYVAPGVLVLCAGFGAGTTAMSVADDMKGAVIDRFRSLDVGGTAVLTGHVAASVVRNLAATVLVFAVAFAIGFRPDAGVGGWLASAGILLAVITAISWVAAAVGLLANSPEAAGGFTFFLAFLPYPSSAFVPVDSMPGWLHGFAEHQPLTPVIESLRKLLLGQPAGSSPWEALAWCAALTVGSMAAAAVLFRRRVR
ncbi:multidrug ABC transporter permease [Streptomyces sp. WAC 06738]|uniref:ABC transporter permease n=1 Tax=Streptomyces sp. WAC 06738 TaxID=2203210 RepID=UPI000F6D6D7A|nr:ABC transporter permease [Streptomyces sp. WAC 06738]AZM46859.1 multidrug ABC transporter permease [Streptomyces sp. WAC 06738]